MDVSIIIVNYNTLELTKNCIRSIKENTIDCTYEIILVDNASTDGSVEYFSKKDYIRFFSQSENLGFGKANNIGIRAALGKYVFLLNSDAYLCNNAVRIFFSYMESCEKKIGAAGCLLKGADLKYTHSFAYFPRKVKVLLSRLVSPIYKIFGKKINTLDDKSLIKEGTFNVDYVTGADLFVKKELLIRYGAFDPDFFMYFEETEMQYRLTREGYPSIIVQGPEIVHLEGASVDKKNEKISVRKMMMTQRSQFLYFKKTSTYPSYVLFRIFFFIIRIPFLLFGNISLPEKREYYCLLTSKV